VTWIRAGRLLSYFGVHGHLRGEIFVDGKSHALDGFGVVEHAWGASLRVDPAHLMRGFWQWDVLAFHDPPHAAVAALAAAPVGKRALALRGGGRAPGGEPGRFGGLQVRHTSHAGGLPKTWRGRIERAGERIDYEARAVGEPARVLPHGAFFGFEWEGTLTRAAERRTLSGTGYSEFADPGGHLPSLCDQK
jgi:hypothetical protein